MSITTKNSYVKVSFLCVYLQVSPRSLRPRPRTPQSTPTDCLKDHPAILSHTSKRNSTLHSLLLVATWGRHGTADYYRPLLLAGHAHTGTTRVLWRGGESGPLCQTITLHLESPLSRDGLRNLNGLTVDYC